MTELKHYDLLVSHVFYRSFHVLDYIGKNPNMSDLDREAICATIMDALVYKGLIDPSKQSLDWERLCICDDTEHYCYNPQPFVTSIPLEIKEKMRKICLKISGSTPASVFYAKPAGRIHFCVYDMNTVFSAFFDDFTFMDCDYQSPTREGVVVTDRPFIEVSLNGTRYLVDALTKRIFRSDLFRQKYGLIKKRMITKKDFDEEQKTYYEEQISEDKNYAAYILMTKYFFPDGTGNSAEMAYEINMSRNYFPEEFEEAERLEQKINDRFAPVKIRK